MGFIEDIVVEKRRQVKREGRSLTEAVSSQGVSVIAEVKQASPSEGEIRVVAPAVQARLYEQAGAKAISVLTDGVHFGGHLEDLGAVKSAVELPVLRKDFIVDHYQLYEALVYGADAVLLIAAILKDETKKYVEKAREIGLECLVEVHDRSEVEYAVESDARLIGVNNRDLSTFKVELGTTEEIAPLIPDDRLIVAESGIKTRADVERMLAAGADAVLVGTTLMKADDPAAKLRELSK
jgi:indole-3-glycerol phosphate synthase